MSVCAGNGTDGAATGASCTAWPCFPHPCTPAPHQLQLSMGRGFPCRETFNKHSLPLPASHGSPSGHTPFWRAPQIRHLSGSSELVTAAGPSQGAWGCSLGRSLNNPHCPHGHCSCPGPGQAAAGTAHRGADCLGFCAADDTPLWDSFFPRHRPLESSAAFAPLFICLASAFPLYFV